MVALRIGLLGTLRIDRHGEEVHPRTRQQALLLALLAARGDIALDRAEAAEILWPDAERENGLAYLRRALMELRKAGVEIVSVENRLSLEPEGFETDLEAVTDETECLVGLDHPAALAVRQAIRHRLASRHRPPSPTTERRADAMATFLFEALIDDDPEAAVRLIHHRANDLRQAFPPEPALELTLNIRERVALKSPEMVSVVNLAAISAHALTRYGLAERLYLETIERAREVGHVPYEARAMAAYSLMLLATRRLEEARAMAERAVELAEESGATIQGGNARGNLASIQKETMEFEAAAQNYRIAWERTSSELQALVCQSNLQALHAFYGVGEGLATIPPPRFAEGYGGIAESYLAFTHGLSKRDRHETLAGARRLVVLTGAAGMERHLCLALDCAAMALALDHRPEAGAACVRLGSRFRLDMENRRSPSEALAVRRHAPGPYFGSRIAALLRRLEASDPAVIGARAARMLDGSA